MPFNLLIYDNFDKTMSGIKSNLSRQWVVQVYHAYQRVVLKFILFSGNLQEPTYAPDHVFCETARTLHDHFNNAPQLCDVSLR